VIVSRRTFLKSAGVLLAAPAIVKAENIMKIWTPPKDDLIVYINGVYQSPGEYVQTNDGMIRFDHKNVEYQIYNLQMKTWTRITC
jgi:hypothetical protein